MFFDRGVKPLVDLIERSPELLRGGYVADKVTGAASAYLLVLGGVEELYTEVISRDAEAVLKRFGLRYSHKTAVPFIVNRAGDGVCPMEQAVKSVGTPEDALRAIIKKQAELRSSNPKANLAEEK